MKFIVVAFINFYQRFISPHKGFRCAYAALYGGDSCSEAVKKIVLAQGCIDGYRDIRARFNACREANETLIRNGRRRSGRNDHCDCPDCDCIETCSCKKSDVCDGISCDIPDISCDAPCDCSF